MESDSPLRGGRGKMAAMWARTRSLLNNLTGTRKFAAWSLAIYIILWLAERALTLLWEKVLEREAPEALRQMTSVLATDLATGMVIMAVLVLFAPPLFQAIFDLSAGLARYVELHSKRMSRRDYLARIAEEAIALSTEARGIAVMERWHYDEVFLRDVSREEQIEANRRLQSEQARRKAEALQSFAANKMGRARFLMTEFKAYGYCKEISDRFDHLTNFFCVEDMANALEEAAHRAKADLLRDGYPAEMMTPRAMEAG